MAYESANGDLDSALDSILGNVPDGSAQVVPNDVQVNGSVNNIGPDAARSVYESLELEDATGAEIAGADEEQDGYSYLLVLPCNHEFREIKMFYDEIA